MNDVETYCGIKISKKTLNTIAGVQFFSCDMTVRASGL